MKAILHCDRNWGIGKKNDLMFRLPKDMKFFRSTTLNKTVVMGSNTLLSFPEEYRQEFLFAMRDCCTLRQSHKTQPSA